MNKSDIERIIESVGVYFEDADAKVGIVNIPLLGIAYSHRHEKISRNGNIS